MILVTGGTGIVGRKIVRSLLDSQEQVRVFARGQSDWAGNPMPRLRRLGADVISGDIRNADKLKSALRGCTAVIHCAAVMHESKDDTFESINADAVDTLLALAEEAGVQRFIYLSCLGATQYSTSVYLQSKWIGESLVRRSRFYWTVFRPSLIFAEDSQFTRAAEFWVRKTPFVFVVGSGLNRIQPVSADDVAACVVQSLNDQNTVGKCYDLVGPSEYSSTELFQMASLHVKGVEKAAFKIPSSLGYGIAKVLRRFNPRCPVSDDFFRLLTTETIGDPNAMKSSFDVEMIPLESVYRPLEIDDKDDDSDDEGDYDDDNDSDDD